MCCYNTPDTVLKQASKVGHAIRCVTVFSGFDILSIVNFYCLHECLIYESWAGLAVRHRDVTTVPILGQAVHTLVSLAPSSVIS